MAGGGFMLESGGRAHLYEYKITWYFIFSCIVGSLGGSLFGYDLGVSGEFLFQKFWFLFLLDDYFVCFLVFWAFKVLCFTYF